MLVVMLILLTATAMAAVSLQSTQYELRASGYNRAATQTQYISEAAANTTLAWVDATSLDRSFLTHLAAWNSVAPPDMLPFGEPQLHSDNSNGFVPNRQNANRTQWRQQASLTGVVMPPITQAGSTIGTADPLGTLGPRSAYVPGVQDISNPGGTDYVVDMYDCRQLPNTASSGSQVNQGGSGSLHQIQYYCVVTSRGRSFVPGALGKKWTMAGGDYLVNRFTMAHDARGTVVTPPIIVSP
jgi:hypothetical protein